MNNTKLHVLLQLLPVFITIVLARLSTLGLSPVSFDLPELPSFNPDNRLVNVPIERLGENDLVYPESFVLSTDKQYAFISLGDGRIVRIKEPMGEEIQWQTLGRTGDVDEVGSKTCGKGGPADISNSEEKCGRPLGLWLTSRQSVDIHVETDKDVLLVADAYKGFIIFTNVYGEQPKMYTLATRAVSDPSEYNFKLLNAVVQIPNGDIYITETSQHFQRRRIFHAAMDGKPTGRLLRYQPTQGVVEVVADKLFLPNGLTLSHDKKSLLIVCGVRILRFDLATQQMDPTPFVNVMPGTGDNIKTTDVSLYGKKVKCYFAALGGTYKKPFSLLKFVSDKPWFRSVLLALVPYRIIIDLIPKWTALAVYDENGKLIETLTDDGTAILDENGKKIPLVAPWISEFELVGDYMYLSSWYNPFLARIKRADFV